MNAPSPAVAENVREEMMVAAATKPSAGSLQALVLLLRSYSRPVDTYFQYADQQLYLPFPAVAVAVAAAAAAAVAVVVGNRDSDAFENDETISTVSYCIQLEEVDDCIGVALVDNYFGLDQNYGLFEH